METVGTHDPQNPSIAMNTLRAILITCFWAIITLGQLASAQSMPPHVKSFLAEHVKYALACSGQYPIPVSILLAVPALETGYGTTRAAIVTECNNFFSIKGGKGAPCCREVKEYQPSRSGAVLVRLPACFRKFERPVDSYLAFCNLISTKERYAPLRYIPRWDYRRWARELQRAGYATDPAYADKLIQIIERYGLHYYDPLPTPHPYWTMRN